MYNYEKQMYYDVKEAVLGWVSYNEDEVKNVEGDLSELYDTIYDDLWIDDNVTGNASGSYTFNEYDAGLCIAGNFDIVRDALEDWGYEGIDIRNLTAEYIDVTIRCYLLGGVLYEVLSDMMDERDGE